MIATTVTRDARKNSPDSDTIYDTMTQIIVLIQNDSQWNNYSGFGNVSKTKIMKETFDIL